MIGKQLDRFRGGRVFDRCKLKNVESTAYVFEPDGVTVVKTDDPDRDTRYSAGYSALLECPRIEDSGGNMVCASEFTNHESPDEAVKSLRKAAALLCKDCFYAGKTPLQVSMYRAQLALDSQQALQFDQLALESLRELNGVEQQSLPLVDPEAPPQ